MGGDPFARIFEALLPAPNGGQMLMRIGKVTQQAPLEISVAGVLQPAGALWVNSQLSGSSAPKKGDILLLVTADDQTYYVICKVVRAA